MTGDAGERRPWPMGAVLTVTTGRGLCREGTAGVARLLEYLVGEPLMNHQLRRVAEEVRGAVLAQRPWLAELVPPASLTDGPYDVAAWMAWLAGVEERAGSEVWLAPVPPEDHTSIDPLAELRMQVRQGGMVVVDLTELPLEAVADAAGVPPELLRPLAEPGGTDDPEEGQ